MRKLGPNMKRLLSFWVSRLAVPPGAGMSAAISTFTTPGKLADLTRQALSEIDVALTAMRAAPDNPYGNDEEVIAGAIVDELQKKTGRADAITSR